MDNFVSGVYRQGPNYGKAPRIYNWSFTIQREYKNYLFEAAYVGNRGRGLNSTVYINELPFKYLALGNLLGKNINDAAVKAANYSEPFAGFAAGWKGGATLAQALRPFPQYGTVVDINAGVGRTWYDALQTKVERRFGNLQLMGSYVWSKSLSLMTFRQIFSQGAQVQTQDAQNIADAKSLMYFDIPHFVKILSTYHLPIGKGQKFFGSINRLADAFIGGWTIAGVQQYRSGTLIQIQTAGNPLGTGVLFAPVTKANYTGNAVKTGQSTTSLDPNNPNSRWFNYGASSPFTNAPAYTYGTTSMYHPEFRNPWFRYENLSIQKDFNFFERAHFSYRADFINMFNRTDFGGINATIGNVNFGRPGAPQAGGRIISMGAKLEF